MYIAVHVLKLLFLDDSLADIMQAWIITIIIISITDHIEFLTRTHGMHTDS
jgi:hypothetical protein